MTTLPTYAHEVALQGADLCWCSIPATTPQTVHVEDEGPAVVLHVKLAGSARTVSGAYACTMREREHSLFFMEDFCGDHHFTPGKEGRTAFFEAKMSPAWFERTWGSDVHVWGASFHEAVGRRENTWIGDTLPVSPAMLLLLRDMERCGYQGRMRELYLEAKLVELMLLQAEGWARRGSGGSAGAVNRLKSSDIERIYAAKAYIDQHYDEPCSIADLARYAGVNQQKLKEGFRALFATTVFGYVSDTRMVEARRLLLEEKLYVGEVADRVGYKHPHHFTAAFKRRFGLLPGALRE